MFFMTFLICGMLNYNTSGQHLEEWPGDLCMIIVNVSTTLLYATPVNDGIIFANMTVPKVSGYG